MPLLAFLPAGRTSMSRKVKAWSERSVPTSSKGGSDSFHHGRAERSFSNKGAHPFHRSWLQAQYDDYVACEVFPSSTPSARRPASDHHIRRITRCLPRANTLFKHPDRVKRCLRALRRLRHARLDGRDVRRTTSTSITRSTTWPTRTTPGFSSSNGELRHPPRDRLWPVGSARADLPNVRGAQERGIPHHLDDWGPKGGHEWPYWHHQMWEYVGAQLLGDVRGAGAAITVETSNATVCKV